MQFRTSDISSLAADTFPEDDIDQLFQKLQPLAPPKDIVQQILARVKQLPATQRYQPTTPADALQQPLEEVQDASEMPS